jgi:hypothetical protein
MKPPFPNLRERLDALIQARRRSHPHTVRQPGLLRSRLGEDRFSRLQDERRRWIAEHLINGDEEIGKLYRFANLREADWFRWVF